MQMKRLNQQSKKLLRKIGIVLLSLFIITQFLKNFENVSLYFLIGSCVSFAIVLLEPFVFYLKNNYFK